ncbi:MAG: preprotein translocase subunit SecE [Firmicutes bacterium]|nr:preprotein translocase subunit SecE [Bacillota bacterium]
MDEERKSAEEPAIRKEPKPKKPGKPEESAMQRFGKWWVAKFAEYKSEFKKIVWPSRAELIRQSATVIVVSLIFGLYIAAVDGVLGTAFNQFVKLLP